MSAKEGDEKKEEESPLLMEGAVKTHEHSAKYAENKR